LPSSLTDTATIVNTANIVDQVRGAPTDGTPPGLPQASTMITALDGELGLSNISTAGSAPNGSRRRDLSDGYEQVFEGTPDNDAPIVGTAYLTYILVSNSSYEQGRSECLAHCSNTDGCVFTNMYYEKNNPLYDHVFPEKSNLKCVLFGDVHTADEKDYSWNQQLNTSTNGAIKIQYSSGYASVNIEELTVPSGYELVFGPISAANNAPGYMGFAFLNKYDVSACAKLCDTRGTDSAGGVCQYFNIWRAIIQNKPRTYTCAMYYLPTDNSTATNTGQGPLSVTRSRGYRRISYVVDGGFEDYTCPDNGDFCFTESGAGWVGTSSNGTDDATIFHYAPYARTGAGVGLLGSAFGSDPYAGLLTASISRKLVAGRSYLLQFFHSSTYSGEQLEANAFVVVLWNGRIVGSIGGYSPWRYFTFTVQAQGGGNDTLAFAGGTAPAYDFLDDVSLFLLD
ncbi:fruit-body specific protein a, partial [Favolaschia claudopus]